MELNLVMRVKLDPKLIACVLAVIQALRLHG